MISEIKEGVKCDTQKSPTLEEKVKDGWWSLKIVLKFLPNRETIFMKILFRRLKKIRPTWRGNIF